MHLSRCLLTLVLSLSLSTRISIGIEPKGAPKRQPQTVRAESALNGGLRWSLNSQDTFTTFDSITVNSYLANSGPSEIVFSTSKGAAAPLLVLVHDDQELERTVLEWKSGVNHLEYNRLPGAYGYVHRATFDLREFFGRLEPGSYSLKLLWPADAYEVLGRPAKKVDLVSPTIKFAVLESRPKELANGALAVAPDEYDEPVLPRMEVTNHLEESITIDCINKLDDGTFCVPITLRRWSTQGWYDVWTSKRPRDPQTIVVKPGQIVHLVPDHRIVEGDGVYAYSVWIKTSRTRMQAISNSFAIKQFKEGD